MKDTITTTSTIDVPRELLLSGLRELSRGNEGDALEAFTRALSGSADASLGALCSARLLILHGELSAAQKLLEEAVAKEPGLAEAHVMLGQVHKTAYRTFDAARCFRAALALRPDDRRAAAALAELLDVQEP
jgi:Flp pilus assembly protein TadD